ncbi:retinol dehydrogenase 12-like [Amphiura filiformis]|uniref:retinol dehydrogenase 12-like n=1 Tax=Amphiura filiformis TaxID=82378 RepID=UPI003B21CFF9
MGANLTFPEVDLPGDRTFILTGGNGGIGYETAKYIAAHGGRVVLACRSEEKAKAAIEEMQKEYKDEKQKTSPTAANAGASNGPDDLNIEFMKLDLESLASTMEFIDAYKAKGYPLHSLICNAGIAYAPYGETTDGYERMFQINYLSHLLIILHLTPLLRASAPNSRIVMVSSVAHTHGAFDLDNIQGKRSYNRIYFYNHSKLYQVMSMYALDRRLKSSGIGVFSLHPGVVETGILVNNWTDSKVMVPVVHGFMRLFHVYRNPYQGAATTLVAALDPKYDGESALYFDSCKPTPPVSLAKNVENQEALWKYSLECLKDYINEDVLQGVEGEVKSEPDANLPSEGENLKSKQDVKDEATHDTDTGEGRDECEKEEVTQNTDAEEGRDGCEEENEEVVQQSEDDIIEDNQIITEVHATDTDDVKEEGRDISQSDSEDRQDGGRSTDAADNAGGEN